mmetsp:Transcript_26897/g.44665  ORF Transcript_26897/g.44665 Transcript_26897/m.44665 type:complete len:321 (+) Transcript_26897:162-1124(+)|eukprot:CAMPEP_0119313766 /NCGR_PEP_ID=MMETSP1333-20130426/30327_1 /TAXON_ID=418940 /ORGANISM="Scyphosphaera apsteinii, Strain RCC1455" /LENGTH=320 /DNA_ID=CAMNT_0007318697 /DNA_START=150 /DNA_END=1112 /DNA_ORIENTATION=-
MLGKFTPRIDADRLSSHTSRKNLPVHFCDPSRAEELWRKSLQESEGGPMAAECAAVLGEKLIGTCVPTDEPFLKACLRAKKYSTEKACKVAVNYTAFRDKAGWSTSVTAAALERELRSAFNTLLPYCDVYGHVVLTQRMERLDFQVGSLESFQRAGYYLLHRALQRERAQTCGIALVVDFRGFHFRMLTKIGMSDVKRGVAMLQDCFPARLAAIYVLHPPAWLSVIITMLRPLVNEKSLDQKFLVVGSDYSALHECMPKAHLPKDLQAGGTLDFDWSAIVDGWIADEAAAPCDVRSFFNTSGAARMHSTLPTEGVTVMRT